MFASHCGGCYETPCVCPRYYAGKVPTEQELNQLSNDDLKELNRRLNEVIGKRLVPAYRTAVHTNTQSIPTMHNLRPNTEARELPVK